jgi:maltose alpha-D-glucosyltransferase/alpha-amylase
MAFADGEPETYFVPVQFLLGDAVAELERTNPHAIIAHIDGVPARAALVDSLAAGPGATLLMSMIHQKLLGQGTGQLRGFAHASMGQLGADGLPEPKGTQFEQTNSTFVLGDKFLLKIYRQVESGTNSELEIGQFLTNTVHRAPVPKVLGGLKYHPDAVGAADSALLVIVQEFVSSQGTAWNMTMDRVGAFFDRVLSAPDTVCPERKLLSRVARTRLEPDPVLGELMGHYVTLARRLAERTAQVHLALASRKEPAAFAPEAFTTMHQQSIYQWTRALLVRTFEQLRKLVGRLPEDVAPQAAALLAKESSFEDRLKQVTQVKVSAQRIRCHGDLHLGQVLHTGDDFVIIDFEGEPARPLNERSYKRCPLRDVMGMIRSFNYATESVLRNGRYREQDIERLRPWARMWEDHVSAVYLRSYLDTTSGAPFVPDDEAQVEMLLSFYEIEKAIHEVSYELNNRPDWLPIPIAGLLGLLAVEVE